MTTTVKAANGIKVIPVEIRGIEYNAIIGTQDGLKAIKWNGGSEYRELPDRRIFSISAGSVEMNGSSQVFDVTVDGKRYTAVCTRPVMLGIGAKDWVTKEVREHGMGAEVREGTGVILDVQAKIHQMRIMANKFEQYTLPMIKKKLEMDSKIVTGEPLYGPIDVIRSMPPLSEF